MLPLIAVALGWARSLPAAPAAARPIIVMNDRPPLQPKDDLRPRFARADPDSAPKTSFKATPTAVATRPNDAAGAITSNEQLLAEIRALQPEAPSPRPERTPVDLNGIQPTFLLLGAASYGLASAFGFQFAVWAAGFFESHPLDEDAFYVVARLSTVARVCRRVSSPQTSELHDAPLSCAM